MNSFSKKKFFSSANLAFKLLNGGKDELPNSCSQKYQIIHANFWQSLAFFLFVPWILTFVDVIWQKQHFMFCFYENDLKVEHFFCFL